jgi:hypothetical protein
MLPRVTQMTMSPVVCPAAKALIVSFVRQEINLRHGRAGGDGHFLDHVEQPALVS